MPPNVGDKSEIETWRRNDEPTRKSTHIYVHGGRGGCGVKKEAVMVYSDRANKCHMFFI